MSLMHGANMKIVTVCTHKETDKQKCMTKLLLTENISNTNRYSNILEQCFPKRFACKPLLVSKNNHGSSHTS